VVATGLWRSSLTVITWLLIILLKFRSHFHVAKLMSWIALNDRVTTDLKSQEKQVYILRAGFRVLSAVRFYWRESAVWQQVFAKSNSVLSCPHHSTNAPHSPTHCSYQDQRAKPWKPYKSHCFFRYRETIDIQVCSLSSNRSATKVPSYRTRAAVVMFPQSPLVSSDERNAKTYLKSGSVMQQHIEVGWHTALPRQKQG